jgi:4-methylaminobutanoate oxidase (formaldehyde-forming)
MDGARVVIVGGGVIGTSIAYHLTKVGWNDVLLLERHQLTAGTTWHAAGLITSAGFTDETTLWMSEYSRDLYERLEEETGLATGFMKIGHLHLATTPQRLEAMKREHAFQTGFGIDSHMIGAAEVAEMWPMAKVDDVLAAIWNPNDGRANPVDVTMSMARGARDGGARIEQGVSVTGLTVVDGRVTGVETDQGPIEAELVVLASGMWTRDLAATAGVNVPLQAAEHYYLLTEPFEGCHRELPVIEDPERYGYYREEGGGLLVGLFEPVGAPWKAEGIPHDAAFTTLDPDWDRMGPFVEDAMARVPALAGVGIKQLFCGPESFTTNLHPHLGPAPELDGLWIAAGLNSLGILLGGGVGAVMAEWMTTGTAPQDVTHYHVDRALGFEGTRAYRRDRTVELLGALFGDAVFPNWEPETARGIRRSAIHAELVAQGASFGVSMGWEFPLWFAGDGERPEHPTPDVAYRRSFGFERARLEHVAVREAVGVMDMSLMAKFRVTGPDACRVLNHLSAADVDTEVGKVVYTPWCNPSGGMEADLTVTRLGDDHYNVITSDVIQTRILWMIRRAIRELGADAHVDEHTSGTSLFTVQGPNSRELLQRISPDDFSNEAFPYLSARPVEVGYAPALALRVTYLGELGWELHVPADHAAGVYEALFAAGDGLGLRPAGLSSLSTLRLEKGYRDYGHDIDNCDTPLEAGLGFTVGWDKDDFVGREALVAQKAEGVLRKRHLNFLLADPEPLLMGGEGVYRDGAWAGYLRAGAFGHTLGASVGLGSMTNDDGVTKDWIDAGQWEIDVAGQRFGARASLAPLYDPKRQRILAE